MIQYRESVMCSGFSKIGPQPYKCEVEIDGFCIAYKGKTPKQARTRCRRAIRQLAKRLKEEGF